MEHFATVQREKGYFFHQYIAPDGAVITVATKDGDHIGALEKYNKAQKKNSPKPNKKGKKGSGKKDPQK